MSEVTGSKSWREELASLVEDTGMRYSTADAMGISTAAFEGKRSEFEPASVDSESFQDQAKEFAKAWGEMILELGRGCRDVVQQSLLTEDSYIVRKTKKPLAEASSRLRFLNEYLPEDRDPVHAWPVIVFVFVLALAALSANTRHKGSVSIVKRLSIHPHSAIRVQLPDGRYMAYHEQGVPAKLARFSLIAPHGFLSSRLFGIPGIKSSLFEEFGVCLVTYDLPGFGESDPHPKRDLNSSTLDMLHLANAVGVNDKFWVLGYSTGAMHAWAALKYIPDRIAGAAMVAPMINPYETSMSKEEMSKTWENWGRKRKLMYYLARRFPRFLNYFYHRILLSGKYGPIDEWLSLSLGKKDKALIEGLTFDDFWKRNVEESIRQGSTKPFLEEAALLVSNWGFSLADLQVQKKCPRKGIFPWLKFMYSQRECDLAGFLGPIHIWQGMDDQVVPPSMTNYTSRLLPNTVVHKLPEDGHFSYFCFCDECHRQMFSTIFGSPQGPLDIEDQTQSKADIVAATITDTTAEE